MLTTEGLLKKESSAMMLKLLNGWCWAVGLQHSMNWLWIRFSVTFCTDSEAAVPPPKLNLNYRKNLMLMYINYAELVLLWIPYIVATGCWCVQANTVPRKTEKTEQSWTVLSRGHTCVQLVKSDSHVEPTWSSTLKHTVALSRTNVQCVTNVLSPAVDCCATKRHILRYSWWRHMCFTSNLIPW